jgi:hypothetical protein
MCAALKKPVLFQKKFKENFKKKIVKFIMQLFSADAIVFSKEILNFFDPENMKKIPQKLLIIGPQLFLMYWPGCPNGPET